MANNNMNFSVDLLPSSNNTYYLGSSDKKWANVYATTFTGSLEGNASTASIAAVAKHASAAHYSTTNSTNNSGIIKVKIKKQMAWMLTFTLRVYQAYHYTDYIISGYNYNSNHWYLPKVYLLSSSGYTKKTVTFGYDNDANSNNYCTLWVSIPRDQYTGADVFNVTNGFTQIEDLSDAFEIIYEAESTGTVQTTVEAYRPLLYNEKASSATTADSATSMTGTLGIDHGGTGATTASGARTNLGLGTMATQSSSDYVAKSGDTVTGDILGNATATLGSTANPFHQLVLGGATNNNMTAASTNPRITFAEGISGSQPVHIIYTDYDSYRAPAGLKVIGNQPDPAWFEVEGNIYAAAFKGNADTATAFSSNQSITLTGDVTGSASSTGGWSIATTLANSGATAGSYGPSANAEPSYGSTFNVPYITVDAKGRVTAISTKTVKIPASDNTNTLNTAGSTNTTSKIFLVGATSQASSAQTYSHTYVFETDGALSAKTLGVNYGTAANKVTMQWNNTDESLDFVFA